MTKTDTEIGQPLKKRKSLVDYFPEEHILVTSGIILFVVSMVVIVPSLGAVGFLPIITLGKLPHSVEPAMLPTDWAVWMVMGIIIIGVWVASQRKFP